MLIQDYIAKAHEKNEIVAGIYLDLSKAFDTVDHHILTNKLSKFGLRGNALKLLKSYLMERTQTVVINGTSARPREIKIGVPQGSILGPLLFILYINDIVNVSINGKIMLYADDTAIFFKHSCSETLQNMVNNALLKISNWLESNYLTLNTEKTFLQVYSKRKTIEPVSVNIKGAVIKEIKTIKYLGVFIDDDLKFASHISSISNIISRNIGMIARSKQFLTKPQLLQLYNCLVFPYINYCCFIWGSNYDEHIRKLVILQKRSMRIVEGIFSPQSTIPIFKKYKKLKVKEVAHLQILLIMHKYVINDLPLEIRSLVQLAHQPAYQTRNADHFQNNFSTKKYQLFTFTCLGPKLWNTHISRNFRLSEIPRSKQIFKNYLKTMFTNLYQ